MNKYKHIYITLALVAFVSFGFVYYYMTLLNPGPEGHKKTAVIPPAQQTVTNNTKVYLLEQHEICKKYNLQCGTEVLLTGTARVDLNNLTKQELLAKYPQDAGWEISWMQEKIIIQHSLPGLCKEHSKRWHLRSDEKGEMVAVYLGPAQIKRAGGIVQKTNIRIKDLPTKLREKIETGKLEFLSWEELIGTLDSLDEYIRN